jgi:hypothetical protein
MKVHRALAASLFWCSLSISPAVHAAEWNGAWVDNPSACQKVFVQKGGAIAFADDADIHGSGFIIEGNRIRGKMARCAVKVRKEDGMMLNLVAACSTDVAVETVQFSFRMTGDNQIARMFPGIPELDTTYHRCAM